MSLTTTLKDTRGEAITSNALLVFDAFDLYQETYGVHRHSAV